MSREIMQMALATLKNCLPVNYCYNNFGEASPMYKKDGLSVEKINESIKSLEDALAQPEQLFKYSDIVSDGGLDPRNKFDAQPEQEPDCGEAGHDEGRCGNFHCITKPAPPKPEQEPVAYADALDLAKDCNWDTFICQHSSENHEGTRFKIPLYTAPPKREWVCKNCGEQNVD